MERPENAERLELTLNHRRSAVICADKYNNGRENCPAKGRIAKLNGSANLHFRIECLI
jgi:hypothetical protein